MNSSSHQLRSFRLVCKPQEAGLVEDLLKAQGFAFEQEPFWPLARRLTHEPFPLGSSLAARFGYLYIQDRSSMLPPLAFNDGLGPPAGAAILDMCASPGSKTGQLAQMAGSGAEGCHWGAGFVLGNEPSRNRLGTLRANLETLNLVQSATTSYPGESFPDAAPPGGWGFIQLDPPCSGWGTVEKNPKVMDLWQGDKVKPLINIQRQLLKRAFDLLCPGGQVVYSTCTTNTGENEDQIHYAINELGFERLPLRPAPGFIFEEGALSGCWRVPAPSSQQCRGEGGQGFFVAWLKKPGKMPKNATPVGEQSHQPTPADLALRQQEGANRPLAGTPLQVFDLAASARLIDQPGTDSSLLPPGLGAIAGDNLFFLPSPSLPLLSTGLSWRGFPLGKAGKSGGFKISPLLRCLMPPVEQAAARSFTVLNLEDTAPVLALLSGQSIAIAAKGSELGLYYKGLPLCRLKAKGRRAVFTTK